MIVLDVETIFVRENVMKWLMFGMALGCLCWACDDDDDDNDVELDGAVVESDASSEAKQDAAGGTDASGETTQDAAGQTYEMRLPVSGTNEYVFNDETYEALTYAVLMTTYDEAMSTWAAGIGNYWMTHTVRDLFASSLESCQDLTDDKILELETAMKEALNAIYKEKSGATTGEIAELNLMITNCTAPAM